MSGSPVADNVGMPLFIAALLFFIIGSIEAHAQGGWEYLDESPERIIGILDLPDIIACGAPEKRATTRAVSAPSQSGPLVGTVYMRDEGDAGCGLMIEKVGGAKEEVPTLESGYEIPAALVYERRGPWFRIRLKDGSAWIRRSDQKEFLPYPEILRENLGHTMQRWDGTFRATPGLSGRITPLPSEWKVLLDRQLSIEFLGSRRVGNDLWIHIRLITGVCGQTLEGVTAAVAGWIPAYQSNGSPSAWFSSRGC